ncbi:MAG: hypothetical protein ACK5HJ_01420 [Bacteroidota bacterium]|jgi:hypothetical protein
MRVKKYLTDRNIGIGTVKRLCDFLRLDGLEVNSKLTEEKKELLDKTMNSESFKIWLHTKFSLDRMEINESKTTIKPLFYNSVDPIDNLLGERILNSLNHLINLGLFGSQKEILLKIISSDKSVTEKISLLKLSKPFSEPKIPAIRTNTSESSLTPEDIDFDDFEDEIKRENRRSTYDPYEDFSWGGLHGEEAFIGYWNTD